MLCPHVHHVPPTASVNVAIPSWKVLPQIYHLLTNWKPRESVGKTETVLEVPTSDCPLTQRKKDVPSQGLGHVRTCLVSYLLNLQIALIVGQERGGTENPQHHLWNLPLLPSALPPCNSRQINGGEGDEELRHLEVWGVKWRMDGPQMIKD